MMLRESSKTKNHLTIRSQFINFYVGWSSFARGDRGCMLNGTSLGPRLTHVRTSVGRSSTAGAL